MIFQNETLPAIASLLNEHRFQRVIADLEEEKKRMTHSVTYCLHDELPQARANLRALTDILAEITNAKDTIREIDKHSHAKPVKPDRIT
jgi:hypothetical protein